MSSSSWKEEATKRMMKVLRVSEECIRYVGLGRDALANQIFGALLAASAKTDAPVKLSEIAEPIYGTADKGKQDIVRLTIEKTLLKCGIVEKIYFAERDVRYFPAAYRFQEIRRVENNAGQKIDQLIGDVVVLPLGYWPVPREFYELSTLKKGYEMALSKLESDRTEESVGPGTYGWVKTRLDREMEAVAKKLKGYEGISELMAD